MSDDRPDRACREQARRTAAKEDTLQGAVAAGGELPVEVSQQCVDISILIEGTVLLVRVEITVWALSDTPGNVDVQA